MIGVEGEGGRRSHTLLYILKHGWGTVWSGEDIVLYGPCVLELGIVWVLSGP